MKDSKATAKEKEDAAEAKVQGLARQNEARQLAIEAGSERVVCSAAYALLLAKKAPVSPKPSWHAAGMP